VGAPAWFSRTVTVQSLALEGLLANTKVVVSPLVPNPPPSTTLPAGHVAVTVFVDALLRGLVATTCS